MATCLAASTCAVDPDWSSSCGLCCRVWLRSRRRRHLPLHLHRHSAFSPLRRPLHPQTHVHACHLKPQGRCFPFVAVVAVVEAVEAAAAAAAAAVEAVAVEAVAVEAVAVEAEVLVRQLQ